MGFSPVQNNLAIWYFQTGPELIWLRRRKLALTKSCEVTQETEPVMIALLDQDMVCRVQNAASYGSFLPMCIGRYHCVDARCAGIRTGITKKHAKEYSLSNFQTVIWTSLYFL